MLESCYFVRGTAVLRVTQQRIIPQRVFASTDSLTLQALKTWGKRRLRTERKTNLSFWPIILLKNVIIHLRGTVSHEHYSLAAHAAPSRPIKLQKRQTKL